MILCSFGYRPNGFRSDELDQQKKLFAESVYLILRNADSILARQEYFFCNLAFAWCSWPYIGGDGDLFLGYLIKGWQTGALIDKCPQCGDMVLVVCFSGSQLTGNNSWEGFCCACSDWKKSSATTERWKLHRDFSARVRRQFPFESEVWEEHDDFVFSWRGSGLKPAIKKRLIKAKVTEAVSFKELVERLRDPAVQDN